MSRHAICQSRLVMARAASVVLLLCAADCAAAPRLRVAGCPAPADSTSTVALAANAATPDSVAFDVCVAGAAGARVGSFQLALAYDSAALHAARVTPATGFVVSNPGTPGLIRIAGADAHGFAPGSIAHVALARTGSAAPVVRVRVIELNAMTGASLTHAMRVTGLGGGEAAPAVGVAAAPTVPPARTPPPAEPRSRAEPAEPAVTQPHLPPPLPSLTSSADASGGAVHIDSVSPARVRLTRGDVPEVALYGRGFVESANVVLLDGVELVTRPAAQGVIRFAFPTTIPSHSEAPPRQMAGGAHEIRVRNATGTSNVVSIVVEGVP